MNLSYLLQGVPEAPSLNPIARWTWVFPVVESIHICGFGLLVGTALILDMRLMNVFFRRQPVAQVARQVAPWILTGLVTVLITGPYLLTSDAREYIQVPAFRVKMVLLVLAILFHFTVIRRAAASGSEPRAWQKLAGGMSLGLWLSVVVGGLWIGNL